MDTFQAKFNQRFVFDTNQSILQIKVEDKIIEESKFNELDTSTFGSLIEDDSHEKIVGSKKIKVKTAGDKAFLFLPYFFYKYVIENDISLGDDESYYSFYNYVNTWVKENRHAHEFSNNFIEKIEVLLSATKIILTRNHLFKNDDIFDDIIFCIKYAKSNSFFFYEAGINTEDWVNEILWENKKDNILRTYIVNNIENDGLGSRILIFAIEKWFLPRHDLGSVKSLLSHVSRGEKKNHGEESSKQNDPKDNKKGLRYLISANIAPVLTAAFPFVAIILYLSFSKQTFFTKTIFFSFHEFTPLIFIELLFLVTMIYFFVRVWQKPLYAHIHLPRLLVSIIAGYIPLISADIFLTIGMQAPWWTLLITCFGSLAICYKFLNFEIANAVGRENKKQIFKRNLKILSIGVLYSSVIGLFILDIFHFAILTPKRIAESLISNIEARFLRGIFGNIDPQLLLFLFPLALFIGIVIQLIWEEKPITDPLK